jgi:hypothetical protein
MSNFSRDFLKPIFKENKIRNFVKSSRGNKHAHAYAHTHIHTYTHTHAQTNTPVGYKQFQSLSTGPKSPL